MSETRKNRTSASTWPVIRQGRDRILIEEPDFGSRVGEADSPADASRSHPTEDTREIDVAHPGDLIGGQYQIVREIAAGTMGRVYLAHQLKIDRLVALKIMRQHGVLADERFAKRFCREASVAAQLNHPNIVSVFDYGETSDGKLFMVMEHLEGEPLAALLKDGPLDTNYALEIAIQIARALRRAHAAGVVHRDLKPANVIVKTDDDGLVLVKVLDFGLVKLFAPENSEVSAPFSDDELTRPGNMVGTPDYVSPEQALGDEVDAGTDVYALGVLLFHMIAGRLPFVGDSIVELVKQHLQAEVPPIHSVNPDADCSPELEACIQRAMAKMRTDRFESMELFLEALKLAGSRALDTIDPLSSFSPVQELRTDDMAVSSQVESLLTVDEIRILRRPQHRAGLIAIGLSVVAVSFLAVCLALDAIEARPTAVERPDADPRPAEDPRVHEEPRVREEPVEAPEPTREVKSTNAPKKKKKSRAKRSDR